MSKGSRFSNFRSSSRNVRLLADPNEGIEIVVGLHEALRPVDGGRLLLEGLEAKEVHVPGCLEVREVDVSRDRIRIVIAPLDPRSVRLDHLLLGARRATAKVRVPLCERVLEAYARPLESLHRRRPSSVFTGVHGRLSTANLLVSASGETMLIGGGFEGLSSILSPPIPAVHRVRLQAPEISCGGESSARADVFTLGAIAYEILAGAPYRSTWVGPDLLARASQPHAPDLPGAIQVPTPEIVEVLATALAPDPADRFGSPTELWRAFAATLASQRRRSWSDETWATFIASASPKNAPRGAQALLANHRSKPRARAATLVDAPAARRRAVDEARPPTESPRITPPPPAWTTRPAPRPDSALTRDNLFADVDAWEEITPSKPLPKRAAPPPPPLPSIPPPRIPRPSEHGSFTFGEALDSTDEMDIDEKAVALRGGQLKNLRRARRHRRTTQAALLLFGAAAVLSLLTLWLLAA